MQGSLRLTCCMGLGSFEIDFQVLFGQVSVNMSCREGASLLKLDSLGYLHKAVCICHAERK